MTPHAQYNAYCRRLFLVCAGIGLLMVLAMAMAGCATPPLENDITPAGYETVIAQGKQDAINWFTRKHGYPPAKVPFLRYIPEAQPDRGGMWIEGNRVHFWVGFENKRNGFDHENRHAINRVTGFGKIPGTKEDEEATR